MGVIDPVFDLVTEHFGHNYLELVNLRVCIYE